MIASLFVMHTLDWVMWYAHLVGLDGLYGWAEARHQKEYAATFSPWLDEDGRVRER